MLKLATIIFSDLLLVSIVVANVYDCWDPDKLSKMKFKESRDEQSDPNLSQFSKLLKCITKMQGHPSGNFGNMDFQQWENVARGGQLPPGWNYPPGQQPPPQWPPGQQPPWQTGQPPQWGQPGDGMMHQPQPGMGPSGGSYTPDGKWMPNPNYPSPPMPPPSGQPRPGVHPEDWNNARDPGSPDQRWPGAAVTEDGEDARIGAGDSRSNRKNRKKNPNQQRKKDRLLDESELPGPSLMPELDDRKGPWNDNTDNMIQQQQPPGGPGSVSRDFMMVDDEETSLHRKYGYAIMALSVVVLAVLMVSTIFCCNSSNSTMNQPVTQAVPISQIDNYSIYSYKHGVIPADTLLSTGTLGDSSLHTETLKSTRAMEPHPNLSTGCRTSTQTLPGVSMRPTVTTENCELRLSDFLQC